MKIRGVFLVFWKKKRRLGVDVEGEEEEGEEIKEEEAEEHEWEED